MKIIVVGGGGREHAIIKKLKENKTVEKIYALPGNGGIAEDAECVDIKATDIEGIVSFAVNHDIDYAVIVWILIYLGSSALMLCYMPFAKAAIVFGTEILLFSAVLTVMTVKNRSNKNKRT